MDELLKRAGLTRESLNDEERKTLHKWAEQLSKSQVHVHDVQTYISEMIVAVEKELAGYDTPKSFTAFLFRGKRELQLKARLYNYLLLRDFLTAPEKARRFMEKHLENLKVNG